MESRSVSALSRYGEAYTLHAVERNPSYFLATIMLPTFIVVLLAQGSLFIRDDGGGDDNHTRFNTFMLSLLTVAAYKSSIQSFLPKKSYLTLAD